MYKIHIQLYMYCISGCCGLGSCIKMHLLLGVGSKVYAKSVIFSSLKIGQPDFGKIETKGLKIERGGKAIFSELKIADFPETLDPTP